MAGYCADELPLPAIAPPSDSQSAGDGDGASFRSGQRTHSNSVWRALYYFIAVRLLENF